MSRDTPGVSIAVSGSLIGISNLQKPIAISSVEPFATSPEFLTMLVCQSSFPGLGLLSSMASARESETHARGARQRDLPEPRTTRARARARAFHEFGKREIVHQRFHVRSLLYGEESQADAGEGESEIRDDGGRTVLHGELAQLRRHRELARRRERSR